MVVVVNSAEVTTVGHRLPRTLRYLPPPSGSLVGCQADWFECCVLRADFERSAFSDQLRQRAAFVLQPRSLVASRRLRRRDSGQDVDNPLTRERIELLIERTRPEDQHRSGRLVRTVVPNPSQYPSSAPAGSCRSVSRCLGAGRGPRESHVVRCPSTIARTCSLIIAPITESDRSSACASLFRKQARSFAYESLPSLSSCTTQAPTSKSSSSMAARRRRCPASYCRSRRQPPHPRCRVAHRRARGPRERPRDAAPQRRWPARGGIVLVGDQPDLPLPRA